MIYRCAYKTPPLLHIPHKTCSRLHTGRKPCICNCGHSLVLPFIVSLLSCVQSRHAYHSVKEYLTSLPPGWSVIEGTRNVKMCFSTPVNQLYLIRKLHCNYEQFWVLLSHVVLITRVDSCCVLHSDIQIARDSFFNTLYFEPTSPVTSGSVMDRSPSVRWNGRYLLSIVLHSFSLSHPVSPLSVVSSFFFLYLPFALLYFVFRIWFFHYMLFIILFVSFLYFIDFFSNCRV
jgi:hypothetical protein